MMANKRNRATNADLAKITADAVRDAVEFTATIRAAHPHTGQMQNFTVRRRTVGEARIAARLLESGFNNGRKALVYAVTGAGMSYLIPADFSAEQPTKGANDDEESLCESRQGHNQF